MAGTPGALLQVLLVFTGYFPLKSRATAAVYALLGKNRLVEKNEAWEPVGTRTGRTRGNGEAALDQIGSKWAFFKKARAMVLQYRTSPVGARLTAAGQRLENQMGTKPMC